MRSMTDEGCRWRGLFFRLAAGPLFRTLALTPLIRAPLAPAFSLKGRRNYAPV